MKKLLAILVLCIAAGLSPVHYAAAKDVVLHASVVDVKFAKDHEGTPSIYFKLKEDRDSYGFRNYLKGKAEYFKVAIDPRLKNPDPRISDEERQPLFWVLHIIAHHFVGSDWAGTPYFMRLDLKKKEIRQCHFES
ncbi:MAG: hypothetical protein J6P53_05885 [Mailhella sp.]|nr:hypothetical protein [Mailhella sp.]